MKQLIYRIIRGGWRRITKPFVTVYNYFFNRPIGYVYMFHMVSPEAGLLAPLDEMRVSPEFLESFLKERMAQIDFVSVDEMQERMRLPKKDQKPFGVVTFDDGYEDNFTYAYPILKKLQIPFIIYVSVNLIRDNAPIWIYPQIMERIIQKHERIELTNGSIYNCQTEQEKIENYHHMMREIYFGIPYESLHAEFQKLFQDYLTDDVFPLNTLTWAQIEQLAKEPLCTIGAHTMTHIPLNTNNHEYLLYELKKSREILSQRVGYSVCHMSYPNGRADKDVMRCAQAVGYKTAFKSSGPIRQKEKDMFSLPRINIHE